MTKGVAIDAVSGQMPIVGFIDANGQITARLQPSNDRIGQTTVGGKEDADFPRSFRPTDKLRGERVDRDNGRIGGGEFCIGRMVGAVIGFDPAPELGLIGVTIGRNQAAVIEFHQQSGIIFATIGINHQSGEIAA